MTRELSPGHHGADTLLPGDRINCGTIAVTTAMIDAFADLTGDRFEIHMSDKAARQHGFKARVAHGLLVLSLVDGLKNQAPAQLKARASRGWDWQFRAPVLAGDTISVRLVIDDITQAKSQDQVILTLSFTVTNQDGILVQKGSNSLLAYR